NGRTAPRQLTAPRRRPGRPLLGAPVVCRHRAHAGDDGGMPRLDDSLVSRSRRPKRATVSVQSSNKLKWDAAPRLICRYGPAQSDLLGWLGRLFGLYRGNHAIDVRLWELEHLGS